MLSALEVMNPYTPTPLTVEPDRASYHGPMVSFIYLCMNGGVASIATALIGNYLDVWDSLWEPTIVFSAFIFVGCCRLIGSESGGKLLIGTFLIWFPYPLHAGVAACMVSNETMQIREFAFNDLPIVYWWTIILLMITLGWIATTFFLQFSRTRIDATIGAQFVVFSWLGQAALFAIATLVT